MLKRYLLIALLTVAVSACTAVGRLTVKDHTSKSGQRVMAGQAEPKDEYACQKIAQEKEAWGIKGNMDKGSATEKLTALVVDKAPGRGANYVHIMPPSDASVMGINVNTFKDAQVAYYKCTSLPPAK